MVSMQKLSMSPRMRFALRRQSPAAAMPAEALQEFDSAFPETFDFYRLRIDPEGKIPRLKTRGTLHADQKRLHQHDHRQDQYRFRAQARRDATF
jgi:hypothetical protein